MTPSTGRSRIGTSRRSIGRVFKTLLLLLLLLLLGLFDHLLPRRVVWTRRQQTILTTTDRLLQDGDQGSQLQNSLLQSSYSILAGLEGILLETTQSLKVYHSVLQEAKFFQLTVNAVMRHLPLLPKDHVVLLDGVFNGIGRCQDLLMMLLGVGFDMTDLCRMGSPLNLSIVHL